MLFDMYFYEVNTYESSCLQNANLDKLWLNIKNDNQIVNYIREKDEIFNRQFVKHYILHNKTFKKLNIDDSFITSILFSYYH